MMFEILLGIVLCGLLMVVIFGNWGSPKECVATAVIFFIVMGIGYFVLTKIDLEYVLSSIYSTF